MEQKQPLSSGFNSVTKYKYNLLDVIVVINYPLIGDQFGVPIDWSSANTLGRMQTTEFIWTKIWLAYYT